MQDRGPKAVNAGPRPNEGPKPKSGAKAQKWGQSPMQGRNPKVNAGPEPDVRPKPNAVTAGPEPDTEPEPDVGPEPNAVNAGPEPDAEPEPNAVNAGPEPDAEPEPNAVNAGPEPDARLEPDAVNACSIGKCKRCKSKVDAQGLVERYASDHPVMLSVSKKLVSVSLTCEGGSALGPQLALPWRKGDGRRWSTHEGWHDSPVMRGGWPGWTASGHSTSCHGEVKAAGGLPAKVGTTRRSCEVGGRDGRPLVIARLAMER
ncbi:hypothetical protein CDL15_Pgr021089 [Punica granatum]|uniref:Uncharacterized protein n=1 Tax=Punica granatum TaxID=22663 RepID=A0A218WRV8_PUNGR|nr:hypothetical protein CDL15_Pgr021089 [Punica granatum]